MILLNFVIFNKWPVTNVSLNQFTHTTDFTLMQNQLHKYYWWFGEWWNTPKTSSLDWPGYGTDIHQRSMTSYGHVMASSAVGLKLGGFGFLSTTHAKQTWNKRIHDDLIAPYGVLRLSSCSNHDTCRQHTHLTNHGYFDYGKTRKPPNSAPCRDQDGAGSGISGVYLWVIAKILITLWLKLRKTF